jgi:hypothetical protein
LDTNKLIYSKMRQFFLLILVSVCLCSCSSDDNDDSNDTSGDIVGTWTAESTDYTGTLIISSNGETTEADVLGEGYDIDFTVTFGENPNEVTTEGTYSIKVTTTFGVESQEQNLEDLEFEYDGFWIREGDTLVIAGQGGSTELEIVQLTDDDLRIEITVIEDLSDGDITAIATLDVVYIFTR